MKAERIIDYLRKSMSVKEIAQEVGVSDRLVRYWVQGKKNPGMINSKILKGLVKERLGGEFENREEIEAADKAEEEREAIEKKEEEEIKTLMVESVEEREVEEKETDDLTAELLWKKGVLEKEDGIVESDEGLKEKLDTLDKYYIKSLSEPYFNVTFGALMNQWEKGKQISLTPQGVGEEKINWSELERVTGRKGENLKKWYEIYKECPLRSKFKSIAKDKATKQTDKWIDGIQAAALPEPKESLEEGEEIQLELETLKCMVECYPTKDRLFGDKCKISCPRKALCHQIATILQENPILIKERSKIEREGKK